MPDEMVAVPKALLAVVLDNAESDSYSTQAEFSFTDEHDASYKAERALISKLRKLAGIDENHDVVGQGFFGLMNAISEKSK